MIPINKVIVEISVLLGETQMPIRQLLKMGRGSVIDLSAGKEELCLMLGCEFATSSFASCGRGGIGRRAALRSLWGNPWKFESSRPHQPTLPLRGSFGSASQPYQAGNRVALRKGA